MADYIKKIQTASGDKQIDYEALANLPKINGQTLTGDVAVSGVAPEMTSTKSGKVTTIYADGDAIATISDGEDGAQGIQGEPGEAGYTPVKGTDYFTEEDIAEVAQQAAGSIPVATDSSDGLMSANDKLKLDEIEEGANYYSHPVYTARSNGLYKITVNSTGHVSSVTSVAKSDITALGIPSTNTTYSVATTSADGLLPALSGVSTEYLRGDGQWATVSSSSGGMTREFYTGAISVTSYSCTTDTSKIYTVTVQDSSGYNHSILVDYKAVQFCKSSNTFKYSYIVYSSSSSVAIHYLTCTYATGGILSFAVPSGDKIIQICGFY